MKHLCGMDYNRNNTSFPAYTIAKLRDLRARADTEKGILTYYQYVVKCYMTDPLFRQRMPENSRGLLVHHAMGTGKTILAVAVAVSGHYRPIVIVAKALEANFKAAITKYFKMTQATDEEQKHAQFTYVSLNGNNLATVMAQQELVGRLLIIDEAHNFFRAIISNENSNARKVYTLIMQTPELKLLFLTGTVPAKHPFEIVPCFNMLAGFELLPTNYDTFCKHFINGTQVLNARRLANRLVGLVSYVRQTSTHFPYEFPLIKEEVTMSPQQYKKYTHAYEQESRKRKTFKGHKKLTLPSALGGTYYVHSRMISNFVFNHESPKMSRLLDILHKNPLPALIYSQFVQEGGLASIEKCLVSAGFRPYRPNLTKTFATISGEKSLKERADIEHIFNSLDNVDGNIISILLISQTGAEGLDLRGVRQIHIFEPYWDQSRELQVRARGSRLGSHSHLPPSQRNIRSYIYLATSPHGEDTIDQLLYAQGAKRGLLNNEFSKVLQSVALECTDPKECHICTPTNAALFSENLENDILLPDPCRPLLVSETQATELTIVNKDKKEQYFSAKGVFYKYNSLLQGYAPVPLSSPVYPLLVKAQYNLSNVAPPGAAAMES